MEFTQSDTFAWVIGLLVICLLVWSYLRGYKGPDEIAIADKPPTLEQRMESHRRQRDELTTALIGGGSIKITQVAPDGTRNEMFLPNTPPCRRMALASFEQGAAVHLSRGVGEPFDAIYKGVNVYEARLLMDGGTALHH